MATDFTTQVRPVAVNGDRVRLDGLEVDGAIVAAIQQALSAGQDAETTVRRALEIGGAVLLHGSSVSTVNAVGAEVDRLMDLLSEKTERLEATRSLRNRMSVKGTDFEDALERFLDARLALLGDRLERTTAATGMNGRRVGDFVIEVAPERRIVVEAKSTGRTRPQAFEELDLAMANRQAAVGVMVFADAEQAPLAGRRLHVEASHILVVWDEDDLAIDAALQLARRLAVGGGASTLPRLHLENQLNRLSNVIDRAASIRTGIGAARRGLDQAEAAYDDLRADAREVIDGLRGRLS